MHNDKKLSFEDIYSSDTDDQDTINENMSIFVDRAEKAKHEIEEQFENRDKSS